MQRESRRSIVLGALAAFAGIGCSPQARAGNTADGSSGAVNGVRYPNQSNIGLRFRWPLRPLAGA